MSDDDGTPVRVVLRPVASPFALGFLGLAGAALTTSGLDLGWIPGAQRHQVGLMVLIFAPLPQLIASLIGFAARDAVAGTGLGIQAVTWGARGAILLTSAPGSLSKSLGTLLLVSAAALGISAAESATGKLLPATVMGTTAVDYLLSALHELAGGAGLRHAAGIVGLVAAGLGVFVAATLALRDERREGIADEAGVRPRL